MKKLVLSVVCLLSFVLGRAQGTYTVSSSAYEASHVIRGSAGVLVSLSGYNSKGSAQFIQVHNAATVPADAVSGVAEISTVVTTGLNVVGVAEVSTVDTTGLTPAGLDGKYFLISGAAADYYVWFNLDAAGVDPAVADKTAIEVAIATGDTEAQLATKLQTVMHAHAAFNATVDTNVVTITDAATGARTDIAAGDSGLAVAVGTPGVTAVTAASLNNKYFTIRGASDAAFHVWCNVAAGGTDPAPANSTGIEVTLAADDTDSEIATAIQTAVHAHASFNATVDTDTVTITAATTGVRTDIADGDSGLTLAVDTQGVTAVAATVPLYTFTVPATSNFTLTLPADGLYFSSGIVVCNSSTGPTKTLGSADCFFTAIVR